MSEEFSRDFKSLLMYLETCMVDYCGKIKGCKMNAEDFAIASQMNAEGLIEFWRLRFNEDRPLRKIDVANGYTHYVRFSEKAWTLAHKFRRERSQEWINREVEHTAALYISDESQSTGDKKP
jgi:hypothetical protein